MKTMKEGKRSLRSLFRRGLVILSLLSLAFAVACGSSDSGDSSGPSDPGPGTGPSEPGDPPPPTPPAKAAVRMRVVDHPTGISYEGLPPDLTGIKVEVWYDDGSYALETDTSKFFTSPRLVQRWLTNDRLNAVDFTNDSSGASSGARVGVTVTTMDGGDTTLSQQVDGYVVYHLTNPVVQAPVRLPLVRSMVGTMKVWQDATTGTNGVIGPAGTRATKFNAPYSNDEINNTASGFWPTVGVVSVENGLLRNQFMAGVNVTGTLSKQEYFEDDVIEFGGVTVVGVYPEIDLRGVSATFGVFANSSAGTTNGVWVADLPPNWTHAALRGGHQARHLETRIEIPLTQAYLDTGVNNIMPDGLWENVQDIGTVFAGWQGLTPGDKTIHLNVAERRVSLPFDKFYEIRQIAVSKEPTWGDYFQWDRANKDWVDEAFTKGGLELEVFYKDTTQTKFIGDNEFRRARARGQAGLVTQPNFYTNELDAVLLRLWYFSSQLNETETTGQELPFPNQVIDLNVKVLEFDSDITFRRKEGIRDDIYLAFDGMNRTVAADADAAVTQRIIMRPSMVEAIVRTYDLVALYDGGNKAKEINRFIWDERPNVVYANKIAHSNERWRSSRGTAPNNAVVTAAGGRVNITNTSQEIVEEDFLFILPNVTGLQVWGGIPGTGSSDTGGTAAAPMNGISFVGGTAAAGHYNITEQQAGWARTAFNGLTAELEPSINILPYHP